MEQSILKLWVVVTVNDGRNHGQMCFKFLSCYRFHVQLDSSEVLQTVYQHIFLNSHHYCGFLISNGRRVSRWSLCFHPWKYLILLSETFLIAEIAALLKLGIWHIKGLGHPVNVVVFREFNHGRDVDEEDKSALLNEVNVFSSVTLAVQRLTCKHSNRVQLVHNLDHERRVLIAEERNLVNKSFQIICVQLISD